MPATNSDIRISTGFPLHLKTRKLRALLGDGAVFNLIALWCSAGLTRSKGALTGLSVSDIEMLSHWEGDPGRFVEVLTEIGFLDKRDDGAYALHDWEEHNRWAFFAEERSEIARANALKRRTRKVQVANPPDGTERQ